jgi:hypothetical protein
MLRQNEGDAADMAVLRVDATDAACPAGAGDAAARLQRMAPGRPVAVLVHGYRYAPGAGAACPHRHIYADTPARRGEVSWPRGLGLGDDGDEGVAVAFGWPACGTLHGAYHRAAAAGAALASLVGALHATGRGPRITLIGHSLGARVALQALAHLAPGAVAGVILLSAAERRGAALAAAATPAGRAAPIVNVACRENLLFDLALRAAMGWPEPTLGRGLPAPPPGWTELPLHDPATLRGLAALGHRVAAGGRRVCHWSAYRRQGTLSLYGALVDGSLSADRLRAALPAPRRHGIVTRPRWSLHLPLPRKPAS